MKHPGLTTGVLLFYSNTMLGLQGRASRGEPGAAHPLPGTGVHLSRRPTFLANAPRGYRTFLSVASIPATVQSSSPIFRGATRNELFT
jgi:hypothetical protein